MTRKIFEGAKNFILWHVKHMLVMKLPSHMQQIACRKTPVLATERFERKQVFWEFLQVLLIFSFGSMDAREQNHLFCFSLKLTFPDLCKSEPTIYKILEQRSATSDLQVNGYLSSESSLFSKWVTPGFPSLRLQMTFIEIFLSIFCPSSNDL